MFTGLIAEVGIVEAIDPAGRLEISTLKLSAQVHIGDSVAVNGCCLTVARQSGSELGFDVLQESFDRTNLKNLRVGDRLNLERALAAGAPLGGHFVQGHVDCAAPILSLEESGADLRLEIALPPEFAHYIACKGSIAVDGISLTVAEILPKSFAVWIIPHTRAETNLATAKRGDLVNLEFDLLAKYVERILERSTVRPA
ncbi:MAG: riboflavin synthase [Verrucomicrobiota bacterium]|jgi:riboflavin synthase